MNDITEAAEATIFEIKPLPEIVGLLLEDIALQPTFDDGMGATVRMPIPIEANGRRMAGSLLKRLAVREGFEPSVAF